MTEAERLRDALGDRYRIDREIGAGGAATVYLAEDLKHHRKVAIKVLRPELAATVGSGRFLREIDIAAQLQHPNIMPLLDSGEAGGFLYYAMPYVQGESLRDRLTREGELPVPDVVRIISEVADALSTAHQHGVVHRDIKPENILLSGRHALVADFGVAKAVSEAGGVPRFTSVGVALGTPTYMAPEQAAADPNLDARVDIYALGVVAYELLVGRPPFTGASAQEILAGHMTRAPVPVREYRESVPAALESIVMRCLQKRPADRWQTADELVARLEPLAASGGEITPPATPPLFVRLIGGRRGAWYALGAVALVVLAGGGIWVARGRSDAMRAPVVVLRDRTQLTSTGRVQAPAVSPDGEELAFVTSDCESGSCVYGVDIQDVGGSATRRLMDGASGIDWMEWSPDRRNLLVTGVIGDRFGSFLQPLLGGAPQPLPGLASFWAGGDSLLMTTFDIRAAMDSAIWVGVAGLDGVESDSIRIPAAGRHIDAVAVPRSRWLLVTARTTQTHIQSLRLVDRRGKEGDRISELPPLASHVFASADAAWVPSYSGNTPFLVRVPIDAKTGHFGAGRDTIYAGQYSGSSVTADGNELVVTEGSYEYRVWALELAELLRAEFPIKRRRVSGTTPIAAFISPDGQRILITRISSPGRPVTSVMPFEGGPETPLDLGGMVPAGWVDSTSFMLDAHRPGGTDLAVMKLGSTDRRDELAVGDTSILTFTSIPRGGWAWISDGSSIRVQRAADSLPRSIVLSRWYGLVRDVNAAPDGEHLGYIGYNAALDSARLGVVSLVDGSTTPWTTFLVAGNATFRWLPDGSALLSLRAARDTVTLYRVRGPGLVDRVGVIARPIESWTVSNDLGRAVVTAREFRGDAWMSRVVRETP